MGKVSEDEIKSQLQQMDPYEFEELVAKIWELQGYRTTVRKGSGDRGIDIEATKKSPFFEKILIQAKRYSGKNKVGSEDVQKYATLYQQVPDADIVVIVTTGAVTSEAQSLAQDLSVKVVDGDSLAGIIIENQSSLSTKHKPSKSSESNQNITLRKVSIGTDLIPAYKVEIRKKLENKIVELGKTYEWNDCHIKIIGMVPTTKQGRIGPNTVIQFT
jgi:hypothetical protein